MWPIYAKNLYNQLLEKAIQQIIVSEGEYSHQKMQIRNQYMVDNCDLLIAIYDNKSQGGTKNCIEYAKSINKPIIYINPNNNI